MTGDAVATEVNVEVNFRCMEAACEAEKARL
jgi:hypothetical protein